MVRYGQEVVVWLHRHEQLVHVLALRTAAWPSGPPLLPFPLPLSPHSLSLSLPLELPQSNNMQRLHHDRLQSQRHSPPQPFDLYTMTTNTATGGLPTQNNM